MLPKGVILPGNPTIDKIATLAVLELHFQRTLKVDFWRSNANPDAGAAQRWQEDGFVQVDIGSENYKRVNCGSALERIVGLHRIQRTKELDALIQIINHNNRTGFLKEGSGAIAWILREAYKLEMDEVEVVRRGTDVVRVEIAPYAAQTQIRANDYRWFSIAGYIDGLVRTGFSSEEAEKRARYWRQIESMAREGIREIRGQLRREEIAIEWYDNRRIIWVETDDVRTSRACLDEFQEALIVIARNSIGHVNIQTRRWAKLDLRALSWQLKQTEERHSESKKRQPWYYDSRINMVTCGTASLRDVEGTELTKETILRLVTTYTR